MKNNWALLLSGISFIASLVMIICYSIKASNISFVNSDTYLSAILALVALFVTINIGYQIYNAVELKEQFKNLKQKTENSLNLIDQKSKDIENKFTIVEHLSNSQASNISGGIYASQRSYLSSLVEYYNSLSASIKLCEIDMRKDWIEGVTGNLESVVSVSLSILQTINNNRGSYINQLGRGYNKKKQLILIFECNKCMEMITKSPVYELFKPKLDDALMLLLEINDCIIEDRVPDELIVLRLGENGLLFLGI